MPSRIAREILCAATGAAAVQATTDGRRREKYFQIAKCFRDEDLRADRQPEFTQIDIEASFVTPDDIFTVTEGMLAAIFRATRNIEIEIPFDRLNYRNAIDRYGAINPIAVLRSSLSIWEKFFARAVSRFFVARSNPAAW